MKCSGINCPMQYPYDVKKCLCVDTCPYATTVPYTNADRIRAMSDDDMADTMCRNPIFTVCDAVCGGDCKAVDTLNDTKEDACKRTILEWLRQPSEEGT